MQTPASFGSCSGLHPNGPQAMPTVTTEAQKHQARWQEIVEDPLLSELPYKVETNARGQLILSPHTARHSRKQKHIVKRLDELLPEREAFQEWPIATTEGIMQADGVWASAERQREMEETDAEEVWVVTQEGDVHFFTEEKLDASQIAQAFPNQL